MASGNTVGNQNSTASANNSNKKNANSSIQLLSKANLNSSDGKGSQERRPAKRGFAAMDPARQREIAAQGGRAAHESGNAHQFTSEEARAAGKKSHTGQRKSAAASTERRSPGILRRAVGTGSSLNS